MQKSIPTIGIKTFFKYYSEIRMRTIDIALSADLNDREQFLAFKDLYIQTNLRNKFFTKLWISTSTHKHHIISIQYPSHKRLPEKSCLHCLRILIMSWLFKDPVVIMKEIMFWLLKDPVNSSLAEFDQAQSNSKKWPKD